MTMHDPTIGDSSLAIRDGRFGARIAVLAAVLVGTLGAILAVRLPLYVDEAFTIETTRHGIATAIRRAATFEEQPPFYFILLAGWSKLVPNLFGARLLSSLFVAGAVYLAMRKLSEVLTSGALVVMGLALSVNPFLIYAATEARCYALVLLLSVAYVNLDLLDVHLGRRVTSHAVARTIVGILLVYTQYYVWLLVGTSQIARIAFRKDQRRSAAMELAATVVVFIPQGYVLAMQLRSVATPPSMRSVGLVGSIHNVIAQLVDFVLPSVNESSPVPKWVGIAVLIVATALVCCRHRLPTIFTGVRHLFFTMSMAGAGLIAILWYFGDQAYMVTHHVLFLFFPAIILVFSLIRHFGAPGYQYLWASVLLALGLYATIVDYGAFRKPGDMQDVSTIIHTHASDGIPILTFPPDLALALPYYGVPSERLVPIPEPINYDDFDYAQYVFTSSTELDRRVAALNVGRGIWLVRPIEAGYRGIDYHTEVLDAVLISRFVLTESHEADGFLVQRFVASDGHDKSNQ